MSDKQHIDPELVPGAELDPDMIEISANQIGLIGGDVATAGGTVLTSWQGITPHYTAPESETLFAVMDPVKTLAEGVGSDIQLARNALVTFAEEARPIKAELDRIRADAVAFVDSIKGGVEVTTANPSYMGGASMSFNQGAEATITETKEWHEDQATVDKNNALLARIDAQMILLWTAERKAANAIYDIIGYPHIEAATDDNPNGYGVEEIPEGAETPWGTAVEKTENCGEQVVGAVKGFVWDGVIVGGIWGTVTGLGTLVLGYNPATGEWFQGDVYAAGWSNMGMLAVGLATAGPLGTGMSMVPGPVGDFFRGGQEALLNAGKGIIAFDQWEEDPAAAAGTAVFNVATIIIPAGAAVAGVKLGAGTASAAIRTAATVMDVLDPAALAVKLGGAGLRIAVPAISDVIKGMDLGSLTRIDVDVPPIRIPEVDVNPGTAIDVPSSAVDIPPVREVPSTPEPALVGAADNATPGSMEVGGTRPDSSPGAGSGGGDTPGSGGSTSSGGGGFADDATGSGGPGSGTSGPNAPDSPSAGTVLDEAAPYGRDADGAPITREAAEAAEDALPSDVRFTPDDIAAMGGREGIDQLADSLPPGYKLETSEVLDSFGKPTSDLGVRVLDEAGNPVPFERLADEGLLDDIAPAADDLTGTGPDVQVWDDAARADLQSRLGDDIDLDSRLTDTELNRIERFQDLIDSGRMPDWLDRMFQGSQFNISRNPFYDASEVYVTKPGGNPVRLDSYSPGDAVASRKYTQLSEIDPSTAISYLRELSAKYPIGDLKAVVKDVPTAQNNPALQPWIGKPLDGTELRLEVPPQRGDIPQVVLDEANRLDITIRDSAGKPYN